MPRARIDCHWPRPASQPTEQAHPDRLQAGRPPGTHPCCVTAAVEQCVPNAQHWWHQLLVVTRTTISTDHGLNNARLIPANNSNNSSTRTSPKQAAAAAAAAATAQMQQAPVIGLEAVCSSAPQPGGICWVQLNQLLAPTLQRTRRSVCRLAVMGAQCRCS